MARFCKAAFLLALLPVAPIAASEEQQLEKHVAEDHQQNETHAAAKPVPGHPPLCVKCLLARLPPEPGAIAKMPETCSKDGDDCTSSMRCCDKSLSCYEKNRHWATCLPSCSKGIHFLSEWPWQWTSWTCRRLDFEIDKAASTLNSQRVIKPLLYPRKQHEYDEFLNQSTNSGYPIPEEVPRQGFCKSAEACRKKCDSDRRCDCVMYTGRTNRCEKRRACDASVLEDNEGTDVYMKVPEDGEQKQAYDRFDGTNLYNSEGKLLSEGKDVAAGKRHPGDARYRDANISFHTCQRVCDLSKFCQCFVVSKATGRCETYLDCGSSRMISDSMYVVYKKIKPDAVEVDPDTGSSWWWPLVVLLLILLCCCLCVALPRLFDTCVATWREQGPRVVPASPGWKHRRLVPPVKLTVGAVLENAPSVKRWPGRCADCGCQCGRAPSWVPRTGVAVCTEAGSIGTTSSAQKLMVGDVLLQVGAKIVRCVEEVDRVLEEYDKGERVELLVLRPRRFGEYACSRGSRDVEAADPTLGQLSELIKAAKPTHDEIRCQIVLVPL
eukprot:TRINITY_DN4329_c0_g2_i1.p1 TRINITY_DN4329_c0_g2~~TRINITY_DN4329_c0_g2_i1.p1  ORF type:complete len:551 (-),score=66.96 TRINITY_DN4329_c0_g2_i1:155-1807(-)